MSSTRPVTFEVMHDALGYWVEAFFPRGSHQHWAGPWSARSKAYKWRRRFADLWGSADRLPATRDPLRGKVSGSLDCLE
jgi:hypothetical protein